METLVTEQPQVDADQALVDDRIGQLLTHDRSDLPTLWGAQYDLGLAWVWFNEGFGGLGLNRGYQPYINRRLEEEGIPTTNRRTNLLGVAMGAGVLDAHATDEQKDRWLRPMFTTEEIWCQLFSEPGAGSDLAGLSTRAVKDGDEWIINGQKVWNTFAHIAKWGMVVTRTDPDVPKHAGLTYFMVDMEADGVEVRPLYQITGEAEFNEVFFDNVRVPDAYRLDQVGAGWRVSMTTLMNERVAIGGVVHPREEGPIAQAVQVWKETGQDDPVLRDQLVSYWIEAEALRLTAMRASDMAKRGTPGPEGSTGKYVWADMNKRLTSFTVDMMGMNGALMPGGYELRRPGEFEILKPQKQFLRSRAHSIEGGTSEIMLNIIGERVLGLPGEPRVDKEVAWKDVPRG